MKKLMKQVSNFGEDLAYLGCCILTLGGAWLLKIIIKKAIIESKQ